METKNENTLIDTESVLKQEYEKLKAARDKKREEIAKIERTLEDLNSAIRRMHHDTGKKPLTDCIVDYITQAGKVRFGDILEEMKPLGFTFEDLEQTIRETLVRLYKSDRIDKEHVEGNRKDFYYFIPSPGKKQPAKSSNAKKQRVRK